ncbi:MAG: hypothetical protein ACI9MC_000503 [Kiritimatiellia bacterium]|jgi:hypothetical protein
MGCNSAPEGLGITLEPTEPNTLDSLEVTISTEALDSNAKDEVTYRYAWSVDGSRLDDLTEASVLSSNTAKGQTWEVTVTPWDGKLTGLAATASVTVLNSAPSATVELSPVEPVTTNDVTVTVDSQDIDNDKVSLRYVWSLNGSVSSLTSDTLRANRTNKGEVWEVSVFPHDGDVEGEPAVASVTIGNTPPEVAKATVISDHEPATANSTLTCRGTGWSDVDEDAEGYRVQWYVNGKETSTNAELTEGFRRDDAVGCKLTPFDGDDEGDSVQSQDIIIRNALPSVESVVISPEEPSNGLEVISKVGATADADGDEVTLKYSWRVNGRETTAGDTLPPARFQRDDEIVLWVIPTDGYDDGPSAKSNKIIGGNNTPVMTSITLKPTDLFTNTMLEAAITYTDADGDDVDVSVEWYVNSKKISATTSPLDGKVWFERDDVLYAIGSPDDGYELGKSMTSGTIKVKNSLPTTPVLIFDPAEPEEGDDIQCKLDKVSKDDDKDTITYKFVWSVAGKPVAGSKTVYSNDTLDSADWTEDDEVTCTVTPYDGHEDGIAAELARNSRDGQVRKVSGTWEDVTYEECGSGTSCSAVNAVTACTAVGGKVVSHASNGTSSVFSLGATASCQWSTSYFTVDDSMGSSDCLVGVSNLEWSSCCGTTNWHGNTLKFGAKTTVFGFVNASNSGHVKSYSNVGGTTWGCISKSSAARQSGCTKMFVACTMK